MVPPPPPSALLRFGRFEISPDERVLRIDGEPAVLGARAFDVLMALANRRERLVTKQELLDLVWPDVVVEEHNVATQVSTLRKLLGAQAIATVPGRGYRFTAVADGPSATPPAPASSVAGKRARTHLPRDLTPLIGRDEDLRALAGMADRSRLVTLVGPGGIGKSLLAQHLVQRLRGRHRDGVCWIELASIVDAHAVPERLADALGVRPAPGHALEGLCASMASLEILVALDNAEHLLGAVAETVAAMLRAAPGLQVIVTSQAPLRLPAENLHRVGPLAVPEGALPASLAKTFGAVALFAERARSASARFALTDAMAPGVIELCRALDGLPLAIELAAARAPLLGVAQLTALMQDRLKLLTHNRDATAPARQQTLRAALQWSHALLDDAERIVFRRLGVISGSGSLGFIQRVVADESLDAWAVLDALGTLVDRSLVMVMDGEDAGSSAPRYRLLDSPLAFALEQLREAGEEDRLRRRHAEAVAEEFDAAWRERWSGRVEVRAWAEGVLADASNARAALDWVRAAGNDDVAATIAATFFMALPRFSHPERMALADLCEASAGRLRAPVLRLRALLVAVRPMFHPHQARSLELAASALAIARELDREAEDRWPLYQALSHWIGAASIVADPDIAAVRAGMAELQWLESPDWPPHRRAWALETTRWVPIAYGGLSEAHTTLRSMRQWIAELTAAGDDTERCVGSLVDALLECGEVDEAMRVGEAALEQLRGTRDEWSRSMVQSNLVLAHLMRGDPRGARPHLQAVWPLVERWQMYVLASELPLYLATEEGRHRTAARLAGWSDALHDAHQLLRHPLEAAARDRCHDVAREALGDALFSQLHAEGRGLRNDAIPDLAFATTDSPQQAPL